MKGYILLQRTYCIEGENSYNLYEWNCGRPLKKWERCIKHNFYGLVTLAGSIFQFKPSKKRKIKAGCVKRILTNKYSNSAAYLRLASREYMDQRRFAYIRGTNKAESWCFQIYYRHCPQSLKHLSAIRQMIWIKLGWQIIERKNIQIHWPPN